MRRAFMLAAASAVTLVACAPNGSTADTTGDENVVHVTMTDMAYEPIKLNATAGETVTFVFHNEGSVKHEAVFGSLAEQEEHHAEMATATSGHGTDHDGESMGSLAGHEMSNTHAVVVEPGETVEAAHAIDGPTLIGCHVPGHWEAGMKMEVTA